MKNINVHVCNIQCHYFYERQFLSQEVIQNEETLYSIMQQ